MSVLKAQEQKTARDKEDRKVKMSCFWYVKPTQTSYMDLHRLVNDEYLSWDVSYFLNGLLFNRIPLLKSLKWREVTTFKGIKGNLTDKNKPNPENGLLLFPYETTQMGKVPDMECYVGIENIFKLLRVDYVWRLNYRDQQGIDKSGIRVSMHITF